MKPQLAALLGEECYCTVPGCNVQFKLAHFHGECSTYFCKNKPVVFVHQYKHNEGHRYLVCAPCSKGFPNHSHAWHHTIIA